MAKITGVSESMLYVGTQFRGNNRCRISITYIGSSCAGDCRISKVNQMLSNGAMSQDEGGDGHNAGHAALCVGFQA